MNPVKSSFRDTLMLENFDNFKGIVFNLRHIKEQLGREKKRVRPTYTSVLAYKLIKQASNVLNKIFKGTRIYLKDAGLDAFGKVINRLRLVLRHLESVSNLSLSVEIKRMLDLLISFLPSGTVLQLELFDGEDYETGEKEKKVFVCFARWKRNYRQFTKNNQRAISKINIEQFSLRLKI